MSKVLTQRAFSLDALRGYAILTMVLSGTIANTLPRWMYHAQTPPPDHIFTPAVYGITWVDLVFPFFLFAMGAAFPFSLGKRREQGESLLHLSFDVVLRGVQLAFFAIFLQHIYPWKLAAEPGYAEWFTTLAGFLLLFPMFMRLPWKIPDWSRIVVKIGAFGIALVLMVSLHYVNDTPFSVSDSNIIILVLANMAVFGSLIYIFTMHNRLVRLAILPFLMAILLCMTADFKGSWQKALFDFSPFPWLYKFYYLKYLFLVIPGSFAGEFLLEWHKKLQSDHSFHPEGNKKPVVLLLLGILLIVENLYGLLTRQLVLNLFISGGLLLIGWLLLRNSVSGYGLFWKRLFSVGAYLLLLGLFFEAFEGGIRKDTSTFSYYFVTAGLAFVTLMIFSVLCDYWKWYRSMASLIMSGQNPMIAYVGSSVVILPLLNIVGLMKYVDMLSANVWGGFFRGVIITTLVTLMTVFFTKIKWFWRT